MRDRAARARGMTLVEVMLAILALSILLNVIWASISSGLRAERNAEMRTAAIRLASSELAVYRMAKFDEIREKTETRPVEVGQWGFDMTTVVAKEGEAPLRDDLWKISVTIVTNKKGFHDFSYATSLVRSRL